MKGLRDRTFSLKKFQECGRKEARKTSGDVARSSLRGGRLWKVRE